MNENPPSVAERAAPSENIANHQRIGDSVTRARKPRTESDLSDMIRLADTVRSIPNLLWRDGRPRWSPGPTIRAKGYKSQDMKDARGEWMSLDDAKMAVLALNEAARSGTRQSLYHNLYPHNPSEQDVYLSGLAQVNLAKSCRQCPNGYRLGEYIYVFGLAGQFCKIGFTTNPRKRYRSFDTGQPRALATLFIAHGTRADEKLLHTIFAEYRVRNEWFVLDGKLLEWVKMARNGRKPWKKPPGPASK